MPYTPDAPLEPHQIPVLPGTNKVISRSFDDRLLIAEFDDALADQAPWKNSRYEGSKLKGKKINEFNAPETGQVSIGTAIIEDNFIVGNFPVGLVGWEGDQTIGLDPVINNQTTAIYIANSVIGGNEDNQFTTIKNHSYIGISKILLIDDISDEVQIIDRVAEPFNVFHRFITNDFPTGEKCSVKIIDESISSNIRDTYRVKMNKGYLLKTLDFNFAGEKFGAYDGTVASLTGSLNDSGSCLITNNSLYLYKGGSESENFISRNFLTGSQSFPTSSDATGTLGTAVSSSLGETIRFKYGVVDIIPNANSGSERTANLGRIGPNYISSSIIQNKFTQQYYTGSYGLFTHNNGDTAYTNAQTQGALISATAFGSASRFIGVETLQFLANNNDDTTLDEQDKTELHVTFFEGTKDFSSGSFDERSIGTFEVDRNQSLPTTDSCNGGLPITHDLVFKGINDTRFKPLTPSTTFEDDINNAYFQSMLNDGEVGCVHHSASITSDNLQRGITIDKLDNVDIYVQGGALGAVGFAGNLHSGSGAYYNPLASSMKVDNYYSGSFDYQLSFLDKDHTLIVDLDKESELFDGIGENGLLIVPNHLKSTIKDNLEYYLEKAGIKTKTTSTKQNLNYSTKK